MLGFYKDLALHAPGIFLRSLVRVDTTFDILSKLILAVFVGVSNPVAETLVDVWNALTGAEATLNGVPLWWSLVLLGLIFLHGVFRYVKEDKDKVENERDELKEKLKDYEDTGKSKVIQRRENPGPVTAKEWAPDDIEHEPDIDVVCVVPYKAYDTVSSFFDEPATTIEVEDAEDVYLVIVDYEVRGETKPPSQRSWYPDINVEVLVLSQDGKRVRDLSIYQEPLTVSEDGTWRHSVSGNETLAGLPEGIYGLNIVDYVEVPPDYRTDAQREYRDMRLRVIRQ